MSQVKDKEREKVIGIVNDLLEYEILFLDYDRYRSKNNEKFDAIIHANENDYASDKHHYPLTTHPTKTSFWRAFKDIRMKIRNKRSLSAYQLVNYVNKKIQTLKLDEEYLREHVFNIYSAFRQKRAPHPSYIKSDLNQTKFKKIVNTISVLQDELSQG